MQLRLHELPGHRSLSDAIGATSTSSFDWHWPVGGHSSRAQPLETANEAVRPSKGIWGHRGGQSGTEVDEGIVRV